MSSRQLIAISRYAKTKNSEELPFVTVYAQALKEALTVIKIKR